MMADPYEVIRKYGGRKLTKKEVDEMIREVGSETDDDGTDVFKTINLVNSANKEPSGIGIGVSKPMTKLGTME